MAPRRRVSPSRCPFRNHEMLRAGAGLCLIVLRSVLDAGTKNLARQAIEAGVPTYLIDSEKGKPRRLKAGDMRPR